MKHFPFLKNFALACCAVAATFAFSSCSQHKVVSPENAAKILRSSPTVAVYSHNDASQPQQREVKEAGPLPERATRVLDLWLRRSTVKTFSYAYPQYYLELKKPTGEPVVWGICSDGQGNMTGVLIPRDNQLAWSAPHTSELMMYVYEGADRAAYSQAIMEDIADAGYDAYRISVRKCSGLVEDEYLISKPVVAEVKKPAVPQTGEETGAAATEGDEETPEEDVDSDDEEELDEEPAEDEEEEAAEDEEELEDDEDFL